MPSAPSPAEQTVVDAALARGYLTPGQVEEALRRWRAPGAQASLLVHLGAFLTEPARRAELAEVHRQAVARQETLRTQGGPSPPPASASAGQLPGDRVGPYELREELARGGMGVVYRAYHPNLAREVALKVLLGGGWIDPRQLGRFRLEAQAVARLRHPNIVTIHDQGQERGLPYLVMDLVDGQPLSDRVEAGERFAPVEAARIVLELSRALAYAHSCAVIHRDVKPQNVLMRPDGTPLLVDFGLAKDLDASGGGLTQTGALLGTVGYAPPEQIDARIGPVDARADVYGLGATLYALLVGFPPCTEGCIELPDYLAATLERAPTPPSRLAPGVDARLEAICLRCLAKAPADRCGSADELAGALAGWLATAGSGAGARRIAAVAGAAALALALAVGVGGWAATRPTEPAPVASSPAPSGEGTGAGGALAPDDADDAADRARVAEDVRALLERCARAPQGVDREEALFSLVRAGPAAAPALSDWLDAHARALLAIERAALLGAVEGRGRAALEAALDQRAAAPLAAPTGAAAAALRAGEAALERSSRRAGAARASARVLVAGLQKQELGQGRLFAAAVACRALGRLGAPSAAPVLGRYLGAEADVVRATVAGEALCHLGGLEAFRVVAAGLRRFERDDHFADRVGPLAARMGVEAPLEGEGAEAHARRGKTRWALGDLPGALEDYDRALELDGSQAAWWNNRGGLRTLRGDAEGAIADFSRALALDPTLCATYVNRGVLRAGRGDVAGALEDYDRALELDPDLPEVYFNRGNARRIRGELRAAAADYTAAVEADPRYGVAFASRAGVREQLGDSAGAAADATRAIELDPRNAMALFNRSLARRSLGDLDGAIQDCNAALELDPDYADAHANRGQCYADKGDLEGARVDLTRALELNPRFAAAFANRGVVRLRLGDVQGAADDWTETLRLAPELTVVYLNRARARLRLGDLEGTLADCEDALERNPNLVDAVTIRAQIRVRQVGAAAALEECERALQRMPEGSRQAAALRRWIEARRGQ